MRYNTGMGDTPHNMPTGHWVPDHKVLEHHSEEAEEVKSHTSQDMPQQGTKTLL